MRVLICGRGRSLEYIEHLELENDFDFIILVNNFNTFVKENNSIRNFLKNKKIIQQVNICEEGLDREFIKEFDIRKVCIARLAPNGDSSWWRSGRTSRTIESFGYECHWQSDKLEPYMHVVENSSDIAILHAILELEATDVSVIGIDFYEAEYFLGHNESDYLTWDEKETNSVRNRIKGSHEKIVSLFPNVSFYYFTKSTFNPSLKNINITRV